MPTPAAVYAPLRMFARCGGEFIQATSIALADMVPDPSRMFSPSVLNGRLPSRLLRFWWVNEAFWAIQFAQF